MGLALALVGVGLSGCAASPTRIDGDDVTGYAIYRTGRLGWQELEELCRLGVEELVVMDGTAGRRECRMRSGVCADLRIRYDSLQDPREPVDEEFLWAFDHWVQEAQAAGRKIAFRCRHGWHRTGRLAAYYRMRFQGWQDPAAIEEMLEKGRLMDRYPELQLQVEAMAHWLRTGECSSSAAACPQPESEDRRPGASAGGGGFLADACESIAEGVSR